MTGGMPHESRILVVNAGSSSLKLRVLGPSHGSRSSAAVMSSDGPSTTNSVSSSAGCPAWTPWVTGWCTEAGASPAPR